MLQGVADAVSAHLQPHRRDALRRLLSALEDSGSEVSVAGPCAALGIEADIVAQATVWQQRWLPFAKPSFERRWYLAGVFLGVERLNCTRQVVTSFDRGGCTEYYHRENELADAAFAWAMRHCAAPAYLVWRREERLAEIMKEAAKHVLRGRHQRAGFASGYVPEHVSFVPRPDPLATMAEHAAGVEKQRCQAMIRLLQAAVESREAAMRSSKVSTLEMGTTEQDNASSPSAKPPHSPLAGRLVLEPLTDQHLAREDLGHYDLLSWVGDPPHVDMTDLIPAHMRHDHGHEPCIDPIN